MLNLLTDPWVPVRRRSGPDVIRPAQLTERLHDDPVIAVDWPRPDFRVASLEFLIGLLTTTCPPADHEGWLAWWETPPSPEQLDAAFARVAHAFCLDGDGPRFLQDFEDLDSRAEPIERLLIDSPGANTLKLNTDLLVHRDRVVCLSRAAAAMALYTLQSWAPGGGAGNRTGLRGGGPLLTLVVPPARPLWHALWANVMEGEAPADSDFPLVFPWLAPTVASANGAIVTPQTAHPLQCWWGMPRRIRLDFTASGSAKPCDLTGHPDDVQAGSWRQRPFGANYGTWGGTHPLTPHYQAKAGAEILPVHPKAEGIGYRHWLAMVVGSEHDRRSPARCVSTWRTDRFRDAGLDAGGFDAARLFAAGFAIEKNMKAVAFVESEMPLPGAADPDRRAAMDALAADLVGATAIVAGQLRSAVRSALFSPGATVKIDAELLESARERLWDHTEASFFAALSASADAGDRPRHDWLPLLKRTALALFDEVAPLEIQSGGAVASRIGRARRGLAFALAGYGKAGSELFALLRLPPPEKKADTSRSASKRGKKKEKAA